MNDVAAACVARAGATRFTRVMLNKVPEVTVYFWIIKVLSTTVGETLGDLLAVRLGLGLTVTSWIMGVLCLAALAWHMSLRRYWPTPYWLEVVLISVVGTLISDNLVDGLGISLVTTTIVFSIILALVFVFWFAVERTLSIHTIFTSRREGFYWLAILFTFALGTSAGDLAAETLDWGYGPAALIFAGMIGLVAVCYFVLRFDEILCFWVAYVLTRPLGASFGDFFAKPKIAGGLDFGTINTSLIFLAAITILVTFLTVTRADRTRMEVAA
jgi:uncharacterized membrane-anchored protein